MVSIFVEMRPGPTGTGGVRQELYDSTLQENFFPKLKTVQPYLSETHNLCSLPHSPPPPLNNFLIKGGGALPKFDPCPPT